MARQHKTTLKTKKRDKRTDEIYDREIKRKSREWESERQRQRLRLSRLRLRLRDEDKRGKRATSE